MSAVSEEQLALVQSQIDWLPARLKELRESAGFSREQVGDSLGISAKRLWDVEAGRYDIKWSTICRICLAIGITMDKWLAGCPRTYKEDRLPSALERGQHFNFIMNMLEKADLSKAELGKIASWAKEKAKTKK